MRFDPVPTRQLAPMQKVALSLIPIIMKVLPCIERAQRGAAPGVILIGGAVTEIPTSAAGAPDGEE